VLVVFNPYILVFSVKEIRFNEDIDESIASKRWERKAIDESVRQIYNAERWIKQNQRIRTYGKEPVSIPDLGKAWIHRVGVALGSKGRIPLQSADFGKGFIHFHDEVSIHLLLQELDTITDFVNYLTTVESLHARGGVAINGGEENLLAVYLYNNRSFPWQFNPLVVGEDEWKSFENTPEVRKRKEEDKISYLWDGLVETISGDARDGTLEYISHPREPELVLRTMARENRFCRRILGQRIDELLRTTQIGRRRSQLIQSPSGTVYILSVSERNRDRKDRRAELGNRCYVARDLYPDSPTVIGIATENYNPADPGFSFDTCYLHYPEWTEEQHKSARKMQKELGYFTDADLRHIQVYEYPAIDRASTGNKIETPNDTRTKKLESLQRKFPTTAQRLFESREFDIIARQMTLEGYKDWEILEAGCMAVMNYHTDPEGKIDAMDLPDRLWNYTEKYVDTAYSSFPPSEFFSPKRIRRQIHFNRLGRDTKPDGASSRGLTQEQDTEGGRDSENCLEVKTKDNFYLWIVLFPDFEHQKNHISVSEEWRLIVGCDSADVVSFRFCKELAQDLAKYATMIDFWLKQLDSTRKTELNIVVVEEKLFKKMFQDSYTKALNGRSQMNGEPIILTWQGPDGKPRIKLGINDEILRHPRMKRLFYATCGILECIGRVPKSEAIVKAFQLVGSLE
jgi:hypothetical protein